MIIYVCTQCHHQHDDVCDCGCNWKTREAITVPVAADAADKDSWLQTIVKYVKFRMGK